MQACLVRYIGFGWTGFLPDGCRHTVLLVPLNYTWAMWGWPNRFLSRMTKADTEVFVAGDYHGGSLDGIDTEEEFRRLPAGYSGGVWTDEIGLIAPLVTGARLAQ